MISRCFFAVLALTCLISCARASIDKEYLIEQTKDVIISDLDRIEDLTRPYVIESTTLVLENKRSNGIESFYYALTNEQDSHKAVIEVFDVNSATQLYDIESLGHFDNNNSIVLYKIKLPRLLKSGGDKIKLKVIIGLTDVLTPSPAFIDQADKQYLLFTTLKYILSPYKVINQMTKFITVGGYGGFESYTGKEDVSKSDNILTYGPYTSTIEPLSSNKEMISVRYAYTAPIIRVDKLERGIYLSHWGASVEFEDKYWIHNGAANLKTPFVRAQYQKAAMLNPVNTCLNDITLNLPGNTRDAYFVDEIGNVSTSRYISNSKESILSLKPRYPIFGGWNYSFTVGWNSDTNNQILRKSPNDNDKYLLKVPLVDGPEYFFYNKVELTIYLPEGATDVDIQLPYEPIETSEFFYKSFLDVQGRTSIKVLFNNLVGLSRRQNVYVSYKYTNFAKMQKPIIVSATLFILLCTYLLVSRIDISVKN